MPINLYNDKYASSNVSGILAEADGARAEGIALAAGNGALKRGQLLVRDTDSTYKPAANTDITATAYMVVLGEDVDTGSSSSVAAIPVRAYLAGVFMSDKILLKTGTLSAENTAMLRTQGILLKAYQKADGQPSAIITEG
jgi:hypothetical protein